MGLAFLMESASEVEMTSHPGDFLPSQGVLHLWGQIHPPVPPVALSSAEKVIRDKSRMRPCLHTCLHPGHRAEKGKAVTNFTRLPSKEF
jgi:hypothetical protein